MRKICRKSNGFTLVEILVTIAIVGLMLIVSVPAFRNYKDKNDLSRGADLMQAAIYETKNLALSPQTDKKDSTGYYVIRFNSIYGNDEVAIYEAPSVDSGLNDMTLVKKFDLPQGLSLQLGDSDNIEIFYSIEDQGKIAKPTSNVELKIKHDNIEGDNNTKTIFVNHITGQVTIK